MTCDAPDNRSLSRFNPGAVIKRCSSTAICGAATELPQTKADTSSHSALALNDSAFESCDKYLRSFIFTKMFIAKLRHVSLALVLQCPRIIRISRKSLERHVLREFFINFNTENPLSHVAVVTVKHK